VATLGARPRPPVAAGALETAAAAAGERLKAVELQIAASKVRIAERDRAAGDPAVLEESLARIERRLARIGLVRDAVSLAREQLRAASQAVHRRFAPHLNGALAEFLPLVTGGRYVDATVDDALEIQVPAPETGRFVPVDQLSRGTRDQIYLIERIQMARLLDSTTGGSPLLLDDPLARFDAVRTEHTLALLGRLGGERQVVLFTEDARLAEQAVALDPPARLITLPAPGA
jgi:uncharacterized protein YhaN